MKMIVDLHNNYKEKIIHQKISYRNSQENVLQRSYFKKAPDLSVSLFLAVGHTNTPQNQFLKHIRKLSGNHA